MPGKSTRKRKARGIVGKGKKVTVVSCQDLKAAIGSEIKAAVKDRSVAKRLMNSLGTEVAYGTGNGGVGVA